MLLGRLFRQGNILDCIGCCFEGSCSLPGGMLWVSYNSPEHLDLCPDSQNKLGELLERVLTNTFNGFNKCLVSELPSTASTSDHVLARANRFK